MSATRGDESFRFVNLERRWPQCVLTGVEVVDGMLSLARLPGAATSLDADPADAGALAGPSRIGIAPDGTLYLPDPAGHRVLRIEPCGDRADPLLCLRGPGSDPGELREPHGAAVGPNGLLYVADTGNSRIQVLDPVSGQVSRVIGQRDPWGPPVSGGGDGELRQPWDIALDAAGNLYVAEAAGDASGQPHQGRIQKFDSRGRVIPDFWKAVRESGDPPGSPVSIVIVPAGDGQEVLLVIDSAPARVLAYSLDGAEDADTAGEWALIASLVAEPTTATAAGGRLYVADAATGRVFVFGSGGAFLGVARDHESDTIGLALDHEGRLLAHTRSGALQRFGLEGNFVELGTVVAGPFRHEPGQQRWFRVQLTTGLVPEQSRVQLFTFTRDAAPGMVPAAPVGVDGSLAAIVDAPETPAPTAQGRWRALPPGATSGLILNTPGRYVWVAMVLQGSGHNTPRIVQLRLDDDADGWLRHLPALYRNDQESRVFLERALALFQVSQEGIEARLDELTRAIDPWAATDDSAVTSWLEWLSGWLAFPLSELWTEARRREVLAAAYALEATRGTAESLRGLVELYAGARVRISEPATSQLWSLGSGGRLGFDTMLAPADPHGVVLDTTAMLDRSHLLAAADEGMPALASVTNRFCVEAYAADFPTEAARRELVRVIEEEKPAHTTYHLCLIDSELRVGSQARLGIDAIVAGRPGSKRCQPPRVRVGSSRVS